MDCMDMALPVKAAKKHPLNRATYCSLFWLFLFGSAVGFVLEGLWCILRTGAWESHSATVVGPFCIICGIGAAAIYLLSTALKGKGLPLQFLAFSVAGALVEYFGSLLQEIIFGSTSWDYSGQFMNIGGRVSLQMTLIWGILGIAFVRFAFPALVRLLGKMEGRLWRAGCFVLSVLMAANLLLSAAAVTRWRDRLTDNDPPANALEQFLDEAYDDGTMERIYPNMTFS